MRSWLSGLSAVIGSTALSSACGTGGDCDSGSCPGGAGQDSGGNDCGADVVVPPGCNSDADPKDAPLCVVNDFGVFVSPNGKTDAPGAREAPVNSIASALKIAAGKPRIYACKGTYAEKIELSVAVSIFGGFDCASWAHVGEKAVFSSPPAGQYGLRVRSVGSPVIFEDLDISAKPGDQTNPSGIAAFISDSPMVTLRRVKLSAGDAQNGAGRRARLSPRQNLAWTEIIQTLPRRAVKAARQGRARAAAGVRAKAHEAGTPSGWGSAATRARP